MTLATVSPRNGGVPVTIAEGDLRMTLSDLDMLIRKGALLQRNGVASRACAERP